MIFRGLRASADYELKAYACTLVPTSVWGPPEPDKPALMPMLSNVVPVQLLDIGQDLGDSETKRMSGRNLMEQGLSIKAVKSPQIIWIAYHQSN